MFCLPKLKKHVNEQGFTLIELLVVVVVISALSGVVISIINSGGFQDKAKDAQRIADLKQVQTALELYFSDFRQYPDTGGGWTHIDGSDTVTSALSPVYINKVPVDPEDSDVDDPCGSPEERRYNYRSSGPTYVLTAIMAVSSSNDKNMCDDLNGWGSACSAGYATQDFCYGVENP